MCSLLFRTSDSKNNYPLQMARLGDHQKTTQMCRQGNTRRKHEEYEEVDGCELSLSLSMHHHPSSQRSSNTNTNGSSASELSEAISFYSKDCSEMSPGGGDARLNLDLSIALLGAS